MLTRPDARTARQAAVLAALPLLLAAAALAAPAIPRLAHIAPKAGARPRIATFSAQVAPRLSYYGGPVMGRVEVVMVLYGAGTYLPNVTGAASPTMASFYQQLVASPQMDWLCEYDTDILDVNGHAGTQQAIRRGSWLGSVQITPDPSRDGASITDVQIEQELAAQIDAGHLPPPTADRLYMVHFPAGKTILLDPVTQSCVDYCGYHWSFPHGGSIVRYGVVPDMSGGCSTGCGGSTPLGSLTSTAWHEVVEAVTDPDSLPSWYDFGTDAQGYEWGEIADICDQDTVMALGGNGVAYLVQSLWSNAQNKCAISGPTCATTAVAAGSPAGLALELACANPVAGAARFRLTLPAAARVALTILDVAGRRVAAPVSGELSAGDHTLDWAPPARGGVYFARLAAGGRTVTRTFIVLR